MMANFSFTQQGATPGQKMSSLASPQMVNNLTPAPAKALASAQAGKVNFPQPGGFGAVGNYFKNLATGNLGAAFAPPPAKNSLPGGLMGNPPQTSGLLQTNPQTMAAIKAQTVTGADGSSIKHVFDIPEKASPQNNASTGGTLGLINPAQNQASVTPGGDVAQGSQPTQVPPQQQQPTGTYDYFRQQLANQTQQSPATQQGLLQSGQAFQQGQGFVNELKRLQDEEAQAMRNVSGGPMTLDMATGVQKSIADYYARKEQALGQAISGSSAYYSPGIGAAATGAGQQITAANYGAGTTAPVPVSGGGYLISPITGQPVGAPGGASGPEYGANQQSIYTLQQQASSLQAQANGAEQNYNLLLSNARQGGVNDTNVPIINALQQNIQRGLASKDAVTNFKSLIQSVRSQYAAILGGGTVTVEALQEAQSLIPDDISLGALQSLGATLKSDAINRIEGIHQQIRNLQGGTQQYPPQTGNGMNTSIGWDSPVFDNP